MYFLDLDLDFFLNKNAYGSICESGRLGSDISHGVSLRYSTFLSIDAAFHPLRPYRVAR